MNRKLLEVLIAGLVCLALVPGSLFARSSPVEWISLYGCGEDGELSAMAVDGDGNVYVTGYWEYYDGYYRLSSYRTIKYDPDGNQLWYDGYVYQYVEWVNHAQDIAVDGAGNVYVTGCCRTGSSGYLDIVTIKYDPDGNLLWESLYDGGSGLEDRPSAIAVDSANDVYVTGYRSTSPLDHDFITIKYRSTDGQQQWAAAYDGPGMAFDEAAALALDDAGHVYVTGRSDQGGGDYDYATVKYDGDGGQLWAVRYDGPGNSEDVPSAIAVDGAGNAHVTGAAGSPTSVFSDYVTVKYDTDGNQLWLARHNGPLNMEDRAAAIVLDGEGNALVTGYDYASTYDDYLTIKYDPSGNELWQARYDGPRAYYDQAADVAVDGSGNVYVTGKTSNPGSAYNFCTVMYDPEGNQMAAMLYDGIGAWESATAVAATGPGSAVVAGISDRDPTTYDDRFFVTIGYDMLNMNRVGCSIDCTPSGGELPFDTQFSVTLTNRLPGQLRRVSGRIDLQTAGGASYTNWRAGWTNLSAAESYAGTWLQNLPALGMLVGDNVFTLRVNDVTPPPFNQPPYSPSGATDCDAATVTATSR